MNGNDEGLGLNVSHSSLSPTLGQARGSKVQGQLYTTFFKSRRDADLQLRAIRQPFVNIYDLSPHQERSGDKAPLYAEPALPESVVSYLKGRQSKYDYDTVIHTASCHCQAVVFGVAAKPLEEEDPFACLCSICTGVSPALYHIPPKYHSDSAIMCIYCPRGM